jgi:uncharacterized membrane protein YoaK (UPF0700 family)
MSNMQMLAGSPDALDEAGRPTDDTIELSRLEERLPPLLSVIAGMVDLTGFFTLGNIFTAHITGNLVVAAAAAVHGGPWNLAQALAIPVFMLAVAAAWLVARASSLHGTALTRLLLVIQFLLLGAVLVFCVTTKPSANPHGLMAGIAVMVAVCAMAFQYALLRWALPKAVSTAVMTGNLTNAVLSQMEMLSPQQPLMTVDRGRLKRSLYLLIGFLVGCLVAAAAISMLGDWAWSIPTALAAVAIAVR